MFRKDLSDIKLAYVEFIGSKQRDYLWSSVFEFRKITIPNCGTKRCSTIIVLGVNIGSTFTKNSNHIAASYNFVIESHFKRPSSVKIRIVSAPTSHILPSTLPPIVTNYLQFVHIDFDARHSGGANKCHWKCGEVCKRLCWITSYLIKQ